jgi:hypothetical protein
VHFGGMHLGGSHVHFGGSHAHFGGSHLHFGGSHVHFGGSHLQFGGSHRHFGGSHFTTGHFGGRRFGVRHFAAPGFSSGARFGHATHFGDHFAAGRGFNPARPGAATPNLRNVAGVGGETERAHAFRHGHFGWRGFRRDYVGWAGPVFWPYAYDDVLDYAFWPYGGYGPYGDQFWAYGYDDVFAGILLPYNYASVYGGEAPAVAEANPQGSVTAPPSSLAQLCGAAQPISGALSTDSIAKAVRPTPDQRAKLDALGKSEANAEKTLRASCSTQVPTTAVARLDEVQTRLQDMIAAVNIVRAPLADFYSSLSDEQKAEFNALGQSQPTRSAAGQPASLTQLCGPQNAVPVVSVGQIDHTVRPDAKQRTELVALRDAANKADAMIVATCPAQPPLTPPGRLDAVGARLQAMLRGVQLVRPALQNFYASLGDQQKARFDAMNEQPTANQGT